MSTNQEPTTDTERRRETFTRFFEEAEPRLRVALGAALGQERGRDAASEALAYAWENWDRLQEMENPIGYLYRVGPSKVRRRCTTSGSSSSWPKGEPSSAGYPRASRP